jgi:LysM repeat protein
MTAINSAQAQTMRGSRESITQQHQHAVSHGYTFVQTSSQVADLVNTGELVRVGSSSTMVLHNVSYPYARPEVRTLIERLSAQYFNACGEKMTVTSLTRPIARQPVNASDDSVHPAGMAVDLRIPSNGRCRSWLESTLLSLESSHVLDVTRERRPPHYHVAVFPETYTHYLAAMTGQSREYTVQRGDTLTTVAARMGTSVAQLRAANGLRGDLINIGQRLTVPGDSGRTSASTVASATPAPVVREVTHKVQRGETLWRIASRYETSVDVLRRQNDLAGDFLRIGQTLRVVLDGS